ncbi:MAG: tRNA lysidine(34) synthetase TilS [Planctomycetes bacterium]|nr:tRNA lysidine(34) synthetase TilS [Planctomycetota bacterium]
MSQQGKFLEAIADFTDRHGLIPSGRTVIAGISGGADSVAMLHALRAICDSRQRSWRLIAAHLNHRLRPDADGDEDFVRDLAGRWNLEFFSEKIDVRGLAGGDGIEDAARRARYDFFNRAAGKFNANIVAVAHHADDNVETVLHRIIRGTSLRGLAGIPARRAFGDGRTLVRPMLGVTRIQIEEYCHDRGLVWRTDSTNADTDLTRNFIRHELLPLVRRRLNPQAGQALLRLAEAARLAEDYLDPLAADLLKCSCRAQDDEHMVLDAEMLDSHAQAVRSRAVRQAMETLGAPMRDLTAGHFEDIDALFAPGAGQRSLQAGLAVNLPGGFIARRRGGAITISSGSQAPPADVFELPMGMPGEVKLPDGRCVRCETVAMDKDAFRKHISGHRSGLEMLDADKVAGPLICRSRQEGDSFVPLGGPGTRSVSDFLTDLKLGQAARQAVVCICDSRGIVYLAPLRIADRAKVSSATRHVLQIGIE